MYIQGIATKSGDNFWRDRLTHASMSGLAMYTMGHTHSGLQDISGPAKYAPDTMSGMKTGSNRHHAQLTLYQQAFRQRLHSTAVLRSYPDWPDMVQSSRKQQQNYPAPVWMNYGKATPAVLKSP